jgi:hypothetical protein
MQEDLPYEGQWERISDIEAAKISNERGRRKIKLLVVQAQ